MGRGLQNATPTDRQGTLGDIYELESRFDRWRPVPTLAWKETRAGGPWQDLGPHLIDQALLLFGRPIGISVDLATMRSGATAPDHVAATLRYADRRVVLHASKVIAAHGLRFAAHGSRGSWIKHGVDVQEGKAVAGMAPAGDDWGADPVQDMLTLADDPSAPQPVANEPGDYRLFWRALALAIRDEGPNSVPVEAGVDVIEIIESGVRSAREWREIALP